MLSDRDKAHLSVSDLAYLGELSPAEFRQMTLDADTSVPTSPMSNARRLCGYIMSTPARSQTRPWRLLDWERDRHRLSGRHHAVRVTPAQRRRLLKHAGRQERSINAA